VRPHDEKLKTVGTVPRDCDVILLHRHGPSSSCSLPLYFFELGLTGFEFLAQASSRVCNCFSHGFLFPNRKSEDGFSIALFEPTCIRIPPATGVEPKAEDIVCISCSPEKNGESFEEMRKKDVSRGC
jgi:hypothetical protein